MTNFIIWSKTNYSSDNTTKGFLILHKQSKDAQMYTKKKIETLNILWHKLNNTAS